jgi:hypothetical protein
MSESLPDTVKRLNSQLTVADNEVRAWPKSAKAVRARAALLTDLALAADDAGTDAAAVAIAARIAAAADTARASELAVGARRSRPNPVAGMLDDVHAR